YPRQISPNGQIFPISFYPVTEAYVFLDNRILVVYGVNIVQLFDKWSNRQGAKIPCQELLPENETNLIVWQFYDDLVFQLLLAAANIFLKPPDQAMQCHRCAVTFHF